MTLETGIGGTLKKKKSERMHIPGKRKAKKICSEGAPVPPARIGESMRKEELISERL